MLDTQAKNWNPATPGTPTPAPTAGGDHVVNQDPPEVQADMIEAVSPEGRPADPTLRAGGMLKWLMVSVVLVAIAAVAVGFWQGPGAGIAVFVIGCGIGIVVNPEVWAAFFRARERTRVDKSQPTV